MCANAGTAPAAKALTATNIYAEILAGSETLDNAEVPETGRVLVVTPATYALMKKSKDIIMETEDVLILYTLTVCAPVQSKSVLVRRDFLEAVVNFSSKLQAASALERQLREVVIPEVDAYTYGVMCANVLALPFLDQESPIAFLSWESPPICGDLPASAGLAP